MKPLLLGEFNTGYHPKDQIGIIGVLKVCELSVETCSALGVPVCHLAMFLRCLECQNTAPKSLLQANLLPPKDAVLHSDFVRKYVNFARHQVEPSLSDEARESIANAYADLRAKADDRTLPVHH